MKVNIERRSVRVPAGLLPAGTYFMYKEDPRAEDPREASGGVSHGIVLVLDTPGKGVNLYTGKVVPLPDLPYEIIKDVELRGWV